MRTKLCLNISRFKLLRSISSKSPSRTGGMAQRGTELTSFSAHAKPCARAAPGSQGPAPITVGRPRPRGRTLQEGVLGTFWIHPLCRTPSENPSQNPFFYCQESAKGAGGKGARVINCHNFFFTPDRETRRIDHTTTEGTAERKMRQFATLAPFTPAPFRPFWFLLYFPGSNYTPPPPSLPHFMARRHI